MAHTTMESMPSSTNALNIAKDDEDAKKLAKAKEKAKNIKSCKYPLGKAPENLTENQQVKLSQIKSRDPDCIERMS